MGGSPECAAEQWPVDRCEPGCLRRNPDHCYDGKLSGDEVALDCGGSCQRCTNEACLAGTDCLSGVCDTGTGGQASCHAPLTISYTAHELNASVGSIAWSITLANVEEAATGQAFPFKDLKLRYYFQRSSIVEPLLVRGTQSNLRLANGQSRELKQTYWTIERTEPAPGAAYDAYVEVGFNESGQLFPGDSVDLYQQMLTGDPSSSAFDQRANYSFTDQGNAPFLHVTVFAADQLVWGLEPRPTNPRACFARGVNLNGPGLVIDGHVFQAATQAQVQTNGSGVSQSGVPAPVVTGPLATLLQTATRLQAGDLLSLPTANAVYLVYLYAASPANDATPSAFTLQGLDPVGTNKFRSQPVDAGQAWSRLGPYRVNVTDGSVRVGVTVGAINFTGLELWYPE